MDATTLLSVIHRAIIAGGLSRDAECGADSLSDGYVSGGANDGERFIIARHEPLNDTRDGVPHVRIIAWQQGMPRRRAYVPWDATAGDIETALRASA